MRNYFINMLRQPIIYVLLVGIVLYIIDSQIHWISNKVYLLDNVQKKSTILLHKKRGQEHVFSFYVHVTGHIEGKAKLALYQNSSKGSLNQENMISDDVDLVWGGDWYTDEIRIEYLPLGDIKKGTLKIEYTFNGIWG